MPRDSSTVARDVAARKPVLAMKAGRTERGAKAAASHTGTLAGVDIATELIFEKTGILAFTDEGELIRAAMAFATQPIPRGPRVAVLVNTGGPAVIATDVLVAERPRSAGARRRVDRTAARIAAAAGRARAIRSTSSPPPDRSISARALDVLLDDDGIDAVYIAFVTPSFTDTQAIAREIVAVAGQRRKPMVCNFMSDLTQERFRVTQRILLDGGVPCYAYPSDAARALGALARFARLRERPVVAPRLFDDVDASRARAIVDGAQRAGRSMLAADEVFELLAVLSHCDRALGDGGRCATMPPTPRCASAFRWW